MTSVINQEVRSVIAYASAATSCTVPAAVTNRRAVFSQNIAVGNRRTRAQLNVLSHR